MSRVALGLIMATSAGLATAVGSLFGIIVPRPGPRFMGISLGFAAGVMILVSFVQLLPKGIEAVGFGEGQMAFFAGLLCMLLLDRAIPHSYEGVDRPKAGATDARLLRTGVLVAIGIALHNFPEGLATFTGTLANTRLGLAIAAAIAIHNIPEGLAVAAPIYAATHDRKKAFFWSLLSGLSEPFAAGLAALVLLPFLTPRVLGWTLAAVAGVMVFISLDELLPAARECKEEHLSIIGVLAGMALIAASLWLLKLAG